MADQNGSSPEAGAAKGNDSFLFVACFVALVATSFAFIIRVMFMDQWQIDFGLSETQKGEIFGAGMWPFGVSIVLFSLVIDRIGYGRAMIFAFVSHVLSALLMVTAKGYWSLYWGSILNGLAAGTVEAVINPAIASVYPKSKTKMLTILHAGWPGGLALGGVIVLLMGTIGVGWRVNVAIILVPVLAYGVMLVRAKFPVSERVLAGVSYKDMLKEAGAIGCLIVIYMITMEVNRVAGWGNLVDTSFFDLPSLPMTILIGVLTVAYLVYTSSLGRVMYIFLLLIMILLATTELGIDTWIKELMTPPMEKLRLNAGLVLVYTATIMMILRFCIGPIVERLQPLGVLFVSALLAAIGLYFLSEAEGLFILITATVYGAGKCFFWPVTLGLVSERFPRGGALTLNAMGGVGMLGVGILGSQLLGFWQDTSIDENLRARDAAVYGRLMNREDKRSIFGDYKALDGDKVNEINDKTALYDFRREAAAELGAELRAEDLSAKLAGDLKYQTLVRNAYNHLIRGESDTAVKSHDVMHKALEARGILVSKDEYKGLSKDKDTLAEVTTAAKRNAMKAVAILPFIMAVCYLCLILYFRARGGYKAVDLMADGELSSEDEEIS